MSAAPRSRWSPKPPREAQTPQIVQLLRQAHEWRRQLDVGEVFNQAEIAGREGITRARVTQIMRLPRLASDIQEHILTMPAVVGRPTITERALRPIAQLEQAAAQLEAIEQLLGKR